MRLGLVAAGANIAVISLVALVYGIVVNSPQVVGVSLSGVLAGVAIAGAGTSPATGPSTALQSISRLLLNTITSIQEQLDLVNARIRVDMGEQPLLIVTNGDIGEKMDPGIGATVTGTYIAMPLSGVLEDIERLPVVNYIDLKNIITEILTNTLAIARLAEVEVEGSRVRVSVAGVPQDLTDLESFPITPLSILVMIGLARLTGRTIQLVKRGRTPDGFYWILEMVSA